MSNQNLLIKYQHQLESEIQGFDLSLLGESFIGFNDLFKEYFEVTGIQGELVVRTEKILEGSIDVHNLIQIIDFVPFQEVGHLLDFLQLTSQELHQQAVAFFNEFGNLHKNANAFYAKNPLDLEITQILLTIYLTKMFSAGGQVKNNSLEDVNGKPFPERYVNKLKQLVQRGKYKKALKPVVESNVSSISLKAHHNKVVAEAKVTDQSLEGYLPGRKRFYQN